ncbi:MAG: hypothetical protein ACK5JC_08155 [Bacteroidota bacterium]|jgi:hypothetical protein
MFRSSNFHFSHCWLFLALSLSLYGCVKDPVIPPMQALPGITYAPLHQGKYAVYRIDSLVRNDFTGTIDSFVYYLKEVMYLDENNPALGATLFRIERSYSSRPDSFPNTRIWSGFRDAGALVVNEENVPVIKLNFPLTQGKNWDGNARNTKGSQTYTCIKLHENFLLNQVRFDSTAWILQQADSNLIELNYEREIYSTACGMTKRELLKLQDTKTSLDISIPLRTRANKGYTLTQTVINFGKP